ncbi:hypothetical protein BY458DRAFT_518719 [Sporodiniella umbellata]|nr:hypothetical protein BY458DRAFT_518719 [Sporodiniella umbellata]
MIQGMATTNSNSVFRFLGIVLVLCIKSASALWTRTKNIVKTIFDCLKISMAFFGELGYRVQLTFFSCTQAQKTNI